MTVIELRKEAKRLGLTGYSKLNRAQLLNAIDRHNLEQQEAAQAIVNSNPNDWEITTIAGSLFTGSFFTLRDRIELVKYASKYSVVPYKVVDELTAEAGEAFEKMHGYRTSPRSKHPLIEINFSE